MCIALYGQANKCDLFARANEVQFEKVFESIIKQIRANLTTMLRTHQDNVILKVNIRPCIDQKSYLLRRNLNVFPNAKIRILLMEVVILRCLHIL